MAKIFHYIWESCIVHSCCSSAEPCIPLHAHTHIKHFQLEIFSSIICLFIHHINLVSKFNSSREKFHARSKVPSACPSIFMECYFIVRQSQSHVQPVFNIFKIFFFIPFFWRNECELSYHHKASHMASCNPNIVSNIKP